MFHSRLVCDVGSDGPKGYDGAEAFCLSKRPEHVPAREQDAPVVDLPNDKREQPKAIAALTQIAAQKGWVYTAGRGWICPNCKVLLKANGKSLQHKTVSEHVS